MIDLLPTQTSVIQSGMWYVQGPPGESGLTGWPGATGVPGNTGDKGEPVITAFILFHFCHCCKSSHTQSFFSAEILYILF